MLCVSFAHNIAPQDWYVALVSTTVETANPEAELEPGMRLLGPVVEKFVSVSDIMAPNDDGKDDNVSALFLAS